MNLSSLHKLILLLFLNIIFFQLAAQKSKVDKYKNGVEINKGVLYSSLNFSMGTKDAKNEDQLFVYAIKQNKNDFSIRIDPGYVIKKDLAIGLGLVYSQFRENSTMKASDGTITDINSLGKSFAIRPYVKNFIPLGQSNKFYIVIPTELQLGYGNKITESTSNAILNRKYTKAYYYGIEMMPGILAFIFKNFGFEVNVGAFGLSSSIEKTTNTGLPDTEIKKNDLNLKINVLQLSLGFSIYI